MKLNLKPLYLFADSQPLFECQTSFQDILGKKDCKAAYVSFSNNDEPAYYEIFLALMEKQNIYDCMHITSKYGSDEKNFLEQANLILLSGGDVEKGWKKFQKNSLPKLLLEKYSQGNILIGVSAGAVHLGYGFQSDNAITPALNLLSMAIDVHDEQNDWLNLKNIVIEDSPALGGIGISLHGGLAYHVDGTVEALQKPLYEFHLDNGVLKNNLIFPGASNAGRTN